MKIRRFLRFRAAFRFRALRFRALRFRALRFRALSFRSLRFRAAFRFSSRRRGSPLNNFQRVSPLKNHLQEHDALVIRYLQLK